MNLNVHVDLIIVHMLVQNVLLWVNLVTHLKDDHTVDTHNVFLSTLWSTAPVYIAFLRFMGMIMRQRTNPKIICIYKPCCLRRWRLQSSEEST